VVIEYHFCFRYAPTGFWLRTAFIIGMTIIGEFNWCTQGTLFWGVVTAFFHAQIGLAVQHDASHGAMSKNPLVNAFFAYGADIIGNCRWIWLQQHILFHHPYTNHHGLDGDAQSAEPALLFHRYEGTSKVRKAFHKFQHWFPTLYVLFTFDFCSRSHPSPTSLM
jgi:fatty acid desaturase